MAIRLSVLLAVVTLAAAQTLAFEVASIKPNKSDDEGQSFKSSRGSLRIVNMELSTLIENAYFIKSSQLVGLPSWAESEAFNIDANAEEDASVPVSEERERNRLRLQSLLANRFQLKVHRETKLLPAYVLMIGKNGSRLKESAPNIAYTMRVGRSTLACTKCGLYVLASSLSNWLDRLVFDETGLKGSYDISLAFEPLSVASEDGKLPPLSTALQDQLGLKLESKKMPVALLVVDRVERPSTN